MKQRPENLTAVPALILKFRKSRRGNVAVVTAFLMIPLTFAMGMGVDYTLAKRRQDKINGYADAAALAGVTPAMMAQSSTAAKAKASSLFSAQLSTVSDVTYSPGNLSVTATDQASGTSLNRTVTVSYSATSNNMFAALLGMSTLPIAGASTATSSLSPKVDFYMLLDTSPSMEIAATTAGINTMVANTSSQGGCAFGCHESHPSSDNLGNPGGEDNYALARNLGVTLRIDLVNQAVQNLMSVAKTTATQNNTTYRAAIYTMDYSFNTLQTLTTNLSAAASAASNIQAVEVYNNNCLTSANCNNDEDSYLDQGVSSANGIMPAPGSGTSNSGDTPQEVLFIVSDGVDDYASGGSRVQAAINTKFANCAAVKNRGIRIAFLYLTYNPLPTNSWYNTYIAPFQSQIATDAQNCASPGLYFQVNTDGDISSAMNALFEKAVATAHLSQ